MTTFEPPFRPLPLRDWLVERLWRARHALDGAKERPAAQDTPTRILVVLIFFSLGFAVMAAGAATKALWPQERSGYVTPPVARADLVDRNGRILAMDLTHYALYVDPREVWDTAEAREKLAAVLPGVPARRIERVLRGKRRAFLAGPLTPQQKQQVHDLGLPGVFFEEQDRRVYPLGASAAHVLGFTDKGGQGLAGAESALDELVQDEGQKGRPVALSIDMRVQTALEDELQKAAAEFRTVAAMGVVVDVHTGEVLGMASYPDFDPNHAGRSPPANMVNREAASVYELGSIFKVFTLAMALDKGLATLDSKFDVRAPLQVAGQSIHDHEKGDTVLTFSEVFTHSSNIASGKMALMAGPEVVRDYFFERYGLAHPAPIELAEAARPILPRKVGSQAVANMAFGQGISVSPLSYAAAMAAIVNGGEHIPLTVRKMAPGDQVKGRRILKPSTSRTMLDLLRLNVLTGSGKKADAPGLRVGGKTGSAQKPENGRYGHNNISSFAGVFPTDGPMDTKRYLVLITLDAPQRTEHTYGFITAGWNAAPTAGKVIDRIGPYLGVKRAPLSVQQAEKAAAMAPMRGDN
ncbi:MAG TPA: penicillin-binding protein 2 [Caulobacteraceae bacterium]|jgi:cell division protein FtsI (penicillin-binding protein 3)